MKAENSIQCKVLHVGYKLYFGKCASTVKNDPNTRVEHISLNVYVPNVNEQVGQITI